jgi:hypothetical protein
LTRCFVRVILAIGFGGFGVVAGPTVALQAIAGWHEDRNLEEAGSLERDQPIPVFFETLKHKVKNP